jgi:hypothetical protein
LLRFFEVCIFEEHFQYCQLKMSIQLQRKFLFLLAVLGPYYGVICQSEQINVELNWKVQRQFEYQEETYSVPDFENAEFDQGKVVFYHTKKIKNGNFNMTLTGYQTVPALKTDEDYLSRFGLIVTNQPLIEYKVSQSGKEYFASAYVFPFVRENGQLKRLTSFQFELTPKMSTVTTQQKDFATSSVLMEGSGTWYKISVNRSGIHKLDKAFLESCGINTSGLNPAHINIYGNGEGRLPENNSVYRTDDLAKNAIFIQGENDGSFDEGDYILFYAEGPHRWFANGTTHFDQVRNIYSDLSYYFINVNSNETPERIEDLPQSDIAPTETVNSYSYFDIYENDLVSLVKGGQRWYGELFDTELERTFTFSVPNIVTSSPVEFRTAIATNARSSAGTQQRYLVNGTLIDASALPAVSTDFVRSSKILNVNSPSASLALKISIDRNTPNVLTYLDRIVLNARRNLTFFGSQFNFRDLNSVGTGKVSQFIVSSMPAAGFVWDVTDQHNPKRILGIQSGSSFSFTQETDTLREFVASNGSSFYIPVKVGPVSYQNLHGLSQAELLIVTPSTFLGQANRLADLHRSEGLLVNVATTEQVYNEFSSGSPDPVAIRMFAKMFFDRSLVDPQHAVQNLLLFGDGTYDPKNRVSGNNYWIPTFQMDNSENSISALVTDDFFGLLSDSDAIGVNDMMDIGVGRLLITDQQTARQQVDKIEHYMKNGSQLFNASGGDCCCGDGGVGNTYGDWRLNYVQIADDEDGGYFVSSDAEKQYEYVKANHTELNCDKLYLDAFTQVSTAGGQRYPDVFNGVTNWVQRGALLVNYIGHGGEVGLAAERVVNIPQIQGFTNIDRLNLFVSATCEFTKYDDPGRVSAGEWMSLNPSGGSIALMTTTRPVYVGVNTLVGRKFFESVFTRDAQELPQTFGEIMRLTKNGSGSSDNKRSFTLIGDPALRIALPRMKVVTDSINGISSSISIDTLRALSKVTIKGHLEDQNGNLLTGFNGVLSPSVFDKPKMQQTLGQDPNSPVIPFELQRNIVYRGKATVTNGNFEFSFVVPKDINLSFGYGKISYYGNSSGNDAMGFDTLFVIGGIDTSGVLDQQGPEIEVYLNDERFVNGGITDETPTLIAKLYDETGINTVGNGIGHDLTAIIDANTANPIVLNEYYIADMDSYQSGTVRYTLPPLEKGKHTLTLKVWDVNNNSSEETIDFTVQNKEEIALEHVLNYPNPFTTRTEFFFEHNQVCNEMEVQIQIMTVSGRLVKTINQLVSTQGFRSEGIVWDGKDEFGDQLAKGVYVYRLHAKTPDGKTAEKLEKLVLLK